MTFQWVLQAWAPQPSDCPRPARNPCTLMSESREVGGWVPSSAIPQMKPEASYFGARSAVAISSVTVPFAEGGAGGLLVVFPPPAPCDGVQAVSAPHDPHTPPVEGRPALPVIP